MMVLMVRTAGTEWQDEQEGEHQDNADWKDRIGHKGVR